MKLFPAPHAWWLKLDTSKSIYNAVSLFPRLDHSYSTYTLDVTYVQLLVSEAVSNSFHMLASWMKWTMWLQQTAINIIQKANQFHRLEFQAGFSSHETPTSIYLSLRLIFSTSWHKTRQIANITPSEKNNNTPLGANHQRTKIAFHGLHRQCNYESVPCPSPYAAL